MVWHTAWKTPILHSRGCQHSTVTNGILHSIISTFSKSTPFCDMTSSHSRPLCTFSLFFSLTRLRYILNTICSVYLCTYIRGFTKFGIKVLWRLQCLEYLRTLRLKFQKARTKIEVVLSLPCWLSQLNWVSQQGRLRTTSILVWSFWIFKYLDTLKSEKSWIT